MDHFWIYVNEDWDNAIDLPQRDYITWIPFNLNIHNYDDKNWTRFDGDEPYFDWFRCISQTDALWRARREDIDWLLLTDVDEYVRIGPEKNNNESPIGSLSRFMQNYTDSWHNDNLSIGIRLASTFYGRNTKEDKDEDIQLEIDNVWTMPWEKSWKKNYRQKLILDPKIAMGSRLHYASVQSQKIFKFTNQKQNGLNYIPHDEIRVNHYKQPHKGVSIRTYSAKHKISKLDKLAKDTYLRDNFHDLVVAAIKGDRKSVV